MNRLFGTKKQEEPKVVAPPPPEEKKIDLVEQSKKVATLKGRSRTE